jgi:hypothetical protein
MIKESQLTELVRHLVREVINTMNSSNMPDNSLLGTQTSDAGTAGLSPVMQQKLAREKEIAAKKKVKQDEKMLDKMDNDIKSLKSTYDVTRRQSRPNLKAQVDAEKKSLHRGI